MTTNVNSRNFWHIQSHFQGPANLLIDPRIMIARHIDWQRSYTGYTQFSQPEPDNYNRAVYLKQPYIFDSVPNQVLYRDDIRQGWFTVLMVPPELELAYTEERTWLNPGAYWLNKGTRYRQRQTLLHAKSNQVEITDNQRLAQQGYYENLLIKYTCDIDSVRNRIGIVPGCVTDSSREFDDTQYVNSAFPR